MDTEHLVEGKRHFHNVDLPSSYTNAIPLALDRLDIMHADETGFDFANRWLTALLGKGEVTFQIQPTSEAAKQVEHLFFSARNTEKLKGYRNLGFGFPILTKKDSNAALGVSAMPIFIWDVHLEPDVHQENKWFLSAKADKSVRINPVLEVLSPEVTAIIANYSKKIRKSGVNLNLCSKFCTALAETLHYQNEQPNYNIEQFPEIVDLAAIPTVGTIVWSGIFAAFPPIPPIDLEEPQIAHDYWKETLAEKERSAYQFCCLPCDHHQKAVQIAAAKHRFISVEGAAGSGKNYAITNLAISNLLNGETTLMIAPSIVALEKIAQQLDTVGFGAHVFFCKNMDLDQENLIKRLNTKIEKTGKSKKRLVSDFPLHYQQFDKSRRQLNEAVTIYGKNIFDINNWTETVGLYLKNNQLEGKELLDTQLQVNDFSYDFVEYENLKEKILNSERLFQPVFAFRHPLDKLSNTYFEAAEIKEQKIILTKKLNLYLKKTRNVQRKVLKKINLYKSALEMHHEGLFQRLNQRIAEVYALINQLEVQFGKEYHKTGIGNLRLLKNFSEKSKIALALKSQILDKFEQVKHQYFERPVFDFEFLEAASSGNIHVLSSNLADLKKALTEWQVTSQGIIQDNLKNLNSKTVLSNIPNAQKISEVETLIADLVQTLNTEKIFKKEFKNNATTLQLKQQLLDEIIEQLGRSLHSLRDFGLFYEWKKQVQAFSKKEKKVIQSLVKTQPNNWLAAFDAWYFHNILTQQSLYNQQVEPLLENYLQQYERLNQKTPEYIEQLWQQKRYELLAKNKKWASSYIVNLSKRSKQHVALSAFFQRNIVQITGFFPILLMTAEMAKTSLFPLPKQRFDNLILKDCGHLEKESSRHLLPLAKKVQVFNATYSDAITTDSFINLARSLAGKQLSLRTPHTERETAFMAFNNAAFDQQLNLMLNGQVNREAMKVYEVNGEYDETTQTNEDECRYMLTLLNEISETPQQTYPKVGFVTMTAAQRNLFASYLLKIKQNQSNGVEKIKQLERNGLGIYSLEELSGQQFDLLILSLTFGMDADGIITKHAHFFNTEKGMQQLQALLNAGTQCIYVCHSFSKTFIKNKLYQSEQRGFGILTNFIAYGKAIEQEKIQGLHTIVKQLETTKVKSIVPQQSIFFDEVARYLSAYFEPNRILQNVRIKDEVYSLVIQGKQETPIHYVLIADSFSTNADAFSFVWQQQSKQILAEKGYKFLPIWSRDWWRNPEAAARKLASQIIREDD